MRHEEKYYGLIVKVNNHEPLDLSDDSSDDSIKVNYPEHKEELDITEHGGRVLEPVIETTDEEPTTLDDPYKLKL